MKSNIYADNIGSEIIVDAIGYDNSNSWDKILKLSSEDLALINDAANFY